MPAGTHSIMFIHTDKRRDDVPWWLIMLHACLISLQPLMMCLVCKNLKKNCQLVVHLLARFYYTH